MRRFLIPLTITLIVCFFSGCTISETNLAVYDLKCENLKEPAGIATFSPCLSWKIRSDRNGTVQKAYEILAASDPGLLNIKRADLWNSGKISSDESIFIPWNGSKLSAGMLVYWKIRVWDQNDNISDWSADSFFSTGLVEKEDWNAHYITLRNESDRQDISESPLLRKKFSLDEKPQHLFLHVNSLGYHEIWVNGLKAGENVLTPAVSQFNKRSLVVTYDITNIVKQGTNDLVIWLGRGWYAEGLPGVISGSPVVKAQAEVIDNHNNRKTILVTDSTWTGSISGYSTTGSWKPGKFGGELVDARLLPDDLSSSSLDKLLWIPVNIADIPEHSVTPQMTEANRFFTSIKPVSIEKLTDNSWLVDMGTTLTGMFEIHFSGLEPGENVIMDYCDHLDNESNTVNQGQTDHFISAGKTNEVFRNKFNYHGFRYVRISNLSYEPVAEDITANLVHTGYDDAVSSFECSDNDLNKIHDMIKYTLECLSLGGYLVDCPQIERLGYGGDGNASTLTAQTMFDLAPLYSNWLQAWRDCIREDGGMPHTAPNPYPAGGGPYWCGFIITASWQTYLNYGDKRVLQENYPVMQKWLGYVEKYSRNGMLERWPDTDYRNWYLGDWAVPEGVDQTDTASVNLVNNCFIAVCLDRMTKIAGILGKTADAQIYKSEKEILAKKINARFLNFQNNTYASGSQIDLTFPLLSGIVPDSLKTAVTETLKTAITDKYNGHIACGLVGIPVFTEWTTENTQPDLMYNILKKRDYPGYIYMTENGATTTWEHWNGARSRIHNCYNGIGSWFYQAPGGIRPDDNASGYRQLLINPQVPYGIMWARTRKETPYGPVSVEWNLDENKMNLEISIPVGCSARIRIPDNNITYSINNREMKNNNGYAVAGSGSYKIVFMTEKKK